MLLQRPIHSGKCLNRTALRREWSSAALSGRNFRHDSRCGTQRQVDAIRTRGNWNGCSLCSGTAVATALVFASMPSIAHQYRHPNRSISSCTPVLQKEETQSSGGDDLTNVTVIAAKLKKLLETAQEQLNLSHNETPIWTPMAALIQLITQYKEFHEVERLEAYEASGRPGTLEDLAGLDQYLEFADLAYARRGSMSLKEKLEEEGYVLVRHDTTSVPGYLGHYLAINKKDKVALIGVKGTSGWEDFLTDCCGQAVPYKLADGTKISCHEGVLISAKNLADDLQDIVEELILPTGYQLKIVGHSLGAAGAAMLGLMLKSRVAALREKNGRNKLSVYAFACPPILDYQTAKSCCNFVTSIINNSDLIPRASLPNLAISLKMVEKVNQELSKRGLDELTLQATVFFMNQLISGKHDDMLIDIKEFMSSLRASTNQMDINDPGHLFVPGTVIIMYDRWNKPAPDDHYPAAITAEGFVVADDGAVPVLRVVPLNQRMISDHLSNSYKNSIRTLLNKYGATKKDLDGESKNESAQIETIQ